MISIILKANWNYLSGMPEVESADQTSRTAIEGTI